MQLALTCQLLLITCTMAVIPDHLVGSLPGWDGPLPVTMYSGHINFTLPSGLRIFTHYQYVVKADAAPIILWQQGGPGGSSVMGAYQEMGVFWLNDDSLLNGSVTPQLLLNQYTWNSAANMLYFEHPAGVGFSYCWNDTMKSPVDCPTWTDQSQGEAYHFTLQEFFAQYSEHASQRMYMVGESYAGNTIPSAAAYIANVSNPNYNLYGLGIGNGCVGWAGQSAANPGTCNRPCALQDDIDLFYGHSMMPPDIYQLVYSSCKFPNPDAPNEPKCQSALKVVSDHMGVFNFFNVYDNCGADQLTKVELPGGYRPFADTYANHLKHGDVFHTRRQLHNLGGGNGYPCGAERVSQMWIDLPSVQAALHISGTFNLSAFSYTPYTFSPIDNYGWLASRYHLLIYNGDVDSAVPWLGNRNWTESLASEMNWKRTTNWQPWNVSGSTGGATTVYTVDVTHNFVFATVRESGHMVPFYQPARALDLITKWVTTGWQM